MKDGAKHTEPMNLGDRLITLGRALNDPETTIAQLVILAARCGLEVEIAVVPDEKAPQ